MKITKSWVFLLVALSLVFTLVACNNGSFDVAKNYRGSGNGGDNGGGEEEKDWGDAVCSIGDVGYLSIKAALDAAGLENPTEIVMRRDTEEAVIIEKGAVIVLDLNGKTVSYEGDPSSTDKPDTNTIENKGDLLLTSTKGEGVVTNAVNEQSQLACVANYIGATCVITGTESGKVKILRDKDKYFGNVKKNGQAVSNRGTMLIRDGVTIISEDTTSVNSLVRTGHYDLRGDIRGGDIDESNIPIAELTIEGGVIDGAMNAIMVDSAGKLVLNGGKIKGRQTAIQNWNITVINGGELTVYGANGAKSTVLQAAGLDPRGSTVQPIYRNSEDGRITINGGKFNVSNLGASRLFMAYADDSKNSYGEGMTVNINGGEFNGTTRLADEEQAVTKIKRINITVSGGKFSEDFRTCSAFTDKGGELAPSKTLMKDGSYWVVESI